MLPPEETGYFVLESKRAINGSNYRVCVPKAWVTCKIIPGKKVSFEYPAGDEDSVAVRVKNKEQRDGSWTTYIGVILSESESYEEAVGFLQTICEGNSGQIEDNSSQTSLVEAVDLEIICGENSVQIEDNRNQQSHTDAVGYYWLENSKQIEDNTYQKFYEDVTVDLETICAENSEQIEDNSNHKSHEKASPSSYKEAVGYPQTISGEHSEQIKEKINTMEPVSPTLSTGSPTVEEEPVTEPKHSLKVLIKVPKLDQKSEKKKKSEKKHRKKHSKHKDHKSKHRFLEQLLLTDNITVRSSPNSVDTRGDTASCISCQSNCQSSESSPKSLVSEISSVHSAPETNLKNNNNNSYSLKRMLLESLDNEKEHNDGMLSEDRQIVEDLYMDIIRHVQLMTTTVLEMKKSHLIAMENKKILDKLAAKYRIPLHVTGAIEIEKTRKGDSFEEENLQDDEMEAQDDEMKAQDDDIMENEAQANEENDNKLEENLLVERVNPERLLESDSDSQIYTDDESPEDFLPSSPEVIKHRGKVFSKANDARTLKHPGPAKELIQIGRNSRIYISVTGLEKAKLTSKSVKQFARKLFKEVFTFEALRTCSMNGFTRPPLHFKARTVLKKYAMKYGCDVGWDWVEPKELEENLSKFLINTRNHSLRKIKTLMKRK